MCLGVLQRTGSICREQAGAGPDMTLKKLEVLSPELCAVREHRSSEDSRIRISPFHHNGDPV